MPLRTRRGVRRTVRRRRVIKRRARPLTRPAVKQIQRISRRTLLRNTETKRHFIQNENWSIYPSTGTSLYTYAYVNIFAPLTQGIQQGNFVGDSILDPLFVARIQFDLRPNDLSGELPGISRAPEVYCHAWLLASNDQFSQITPTFIDDTLPLNPSYWFLQPRASRAMMNGDSVTVIKHMKRKLRPYDTGTIQDSNPSISMKMVAKLKGRKIFEPAGGTAPNTPADVLKGWNYYLVVGWGIPDGGVQIAWPSATNGPVYISVDRYLYFKDP